MSKHYFKTETAGGLLQAEMGWDKSQKMFYCFIWRFEDEERESLSTWEEPLYSYRDDPFPLDLDQTLDYYLSVCKDHGVDIPLEVVNALIADKRNNAVNEARFWN